MSHTRSREQILTFLKWPVRQIRRASSRRAYAVLKKDVFESQWLTEDKLRELQLVRVRKLIVHAYRTTRYYRELFDGIGLQPQDIRSLSDYARHVPTLEKCHVRERLDDLISSPWRGKCKFGVTSGSTGTPTRYAHPRRCPMHTALWSLVDEMCGLAGNERTLFLWGREFSDGRYHVWDEKHNTHRISFYHLPPQGFREVLELIVEWRPEFIYGYASLLVAVAEALREKGHTALGAKMVRSHAEKLYDRQRETIQQVFGGEVFEHYGSSEINSLGVECPAHEGIHLLSPLRLFELEPIHGKDSHTGELLVTDLVNYAMPFLRYRIGDVVTLDKRTCRCGRSLPRVTIHGRTYDLARLRDGTVLGPVFFQDLLEDPARVERYIVHQRSYDRVDVHVVPADRFTQDYRDYVLGEIRDKLGFTDVRFFVEQEIDAEVAGKYRLLRSDVSAQMVEVETVGASSCPPP
jgi:phenylacetate-CoA ligase